MIAATTGGKSKITISLRFPDQSAFASAYFEEAPILGLGQGALSLIGLLSHAQTKLYTINTVVISTCVPMLPRTLTWKDGFLDTTWIVTRAYRYHISWPLRQVIDANRIYNGEQHDSFMDWFRPSHIAVTHQSLTLPLCAPKLEYQATTR